MQASRNPFLSDAAFLHLLILAFQCVLLLLRMFRRRCPSVPHHYSLSFILSLPADLFALIIHANSEWLYVYLIIFRTFDLLLKAEMFAYIAICLEMLPYCGKIMEIAGDKKVGGGYTLECFCCTVSLSSYACVKTFRSAVFLLSFRFFLV